MTLPDGSRPRILLPVGCTEAYAEEKRERWAAMAAAGELEVTKAPDAPPVDKTPRGVETFAGWSKRWLAYCEERDLSSASDMRTHIVKHIGPVIGGIPMTDITRDDIERVVQALDKQLLAEKMSPKTGVNIWTTLRSAFKEACVSKRTELRARKDNPSDNVAPPEDGDERERTYLYPSEFMRLISCERISVQARRRYALAVYTLSRAGELRALRWDAIDLERGVINFRQASDRRKGRASTSDKPAKGVKRTKGGRSRRIPIEPNLMPLLEVMRQESGGVGTVILVPPSKLADRLREHMHRAGLKRSELFEAPSDPDVAATWAPLTFHDLKGTGVSWMAQRGDDPLVIQQRAAHRQFSTTQRYLREAETHGRDGLAPFPPLPPSILATGSGHDDTESGKKGCQMERDTGFETGVGGRTRAFQPLRMSNVHICTD